MCVWRLTTKDDSAGLGLTKPYKNVFNLIKNCQLTRMDSYVEEYNETYFSELVTILKERAWWITTMVQCTAAPTNSISIYNES